MKDQNQVIKIIYDVQANQVIVVWPEGEDDRYSLNTGYDNLHTAIVNSIKGFWSSGKMDFLPPTGCVLDEPVGRSTAAGASMPLVYYQDYAKAYGWQIEYDGGTSTWTITTEHAQFQGQVIDALVEQAMNHEPAFDMRAGGLQYNHAAMQKAFDAADLSLHYGNHVWWVERQGHKLVEGATYEATLKMLTKGDMK